MKSSPVRLPEGGLTGEERALVALGCELRGRGYRFTTVTPSTHRRILGRTASGTSSLEHVFGWSRPFRAGDLPTTIVDQLADSGALRSSASMLQSAVRFSTLGEHLFVHSAFPTEETDAVFFGPDTYRFARLIRQCLATLQDRSCLRIIDVGAGSGAGGLHAAALMAETTPEVLLTDVNLRALRYCRINAAINGISLVQTVQSDLFENVHGKFDLIISNPPYLVDPLTRLYRHGGGELGSELSLMIVEQGIERLAPAGRLLLYTGSAVVDGSDPFYEALRSRLTGRDVRFQYEEIDPDVFSEELEHPPYDRADRIAVVGVTIEIEGDNV